MSGVPGARARRDKHPSVTVDSPVPHVSTHDAWAVLTLGVRACS